VATVAEEIPEGGEARTEWGSPVEPASLVERTSPETAVNNLLRAMSTYGRITEKTQRIVEAASCRFSKLVPKLRLGTCRPKLRFASAETAKIIQIAKPNEAELRRAAFPSGAWERAKNSDQLPSPSELWRVPLPQFFCA
jgi:hypothetical protein